jgi:GTP cyclohydrolase II
MEELKDFVDTSLPTENGDFQIRVYRDLPNKETVVLWTEGIEKKQPCLVRVHSECFTGDVMGSKKCDCGKQLKKSLQMIRATGGILIYLRQEGRGIGLFEKIKAYQLQAKGKDTFEANIALGHSPDPRSYEMAKRALDDLGVSKIRLLTNNPSKVSELAKLGVEVVERIPVIAKLNPYNKNYLNSKKLKFSHFLDDHEEPYFYKLQVQSKSQVDEIIKFLPEKILDPTLRIGIGVSASWKTFSEPDELIRIRDIQRVCSSSSRIESIMHLSFKNAKNLESVLEQAELHFGQFDRIQLNDLPCLDIPIIKKASQLFRIDLPLGFNELSWLNDPSARQTLRKCQAHIVLDPSKGTGSKAEVATYKSAINRLLNHGFHDITLCGGFGPDRLETYFALRRYYKINFSCDAETYLKSDNKFDLIKIRLYLEQLLRFDDPNYSGVQQTREFLKDSSTGKPSFVKVSGHSFVIQPGVFNASAFPSTQWFAEKVSKLTKNATSFCEVGCGAGIIACLAASKNPNLRVVATDISSIASENALENAQALNLQDRFKICSGDVFDGIDLREKFDVIFWALPFGFLDPGAEISNEERQVFDPGYRAIRKFISSVYSRLNPGGKVFMGFSPDLGHFDLLADIASQEGLNLIKIDEKSMRETNSVNFEILELSLKIAQRPSILSGESILGKSDRIRNHQIKATESQ